MKAIIYKIESVDKTGHFVEIDLPVPKAEGHDLLVAIEAISVNPVDFKVRKSISAPSLSQKFWAGMLRV